MRGPSRAAPRGALAAALAAFAGALAAAPPARAAEADATLLAGDEAEARPLLRAAPGDMALIARLTLAARLEGLDAYPVDRTGATLDEGLEGNVLARAGLLFHTDRRLAPFFLAAEVEGDAIGGPVTDGPDLEGRGLPGTGEAKARLRKASLSVGLPGVLTLSGGVTTSHWGLGLLANDGAHGWTPGSAAFTDPRGGDVVLRGALAAGPFGSARVLAALAVDRALFDDTLRDGDEARQVVAAVMVGYQQPTRGGLYAVLRRAEARDGATTEVLAVDLHGRTEAKVGSRLRLTLEGEAAMIVGRTDLGPTATFATHDVLQGGAVVRAGLDGGRWGLAFDGFWLSGDRTADDDAQNAFRADPNLHEGLLLYRHVLAGMTGRAPVTASDPLLVGRPADDLERLPSRGAVTGTLGFFPRAWWRPAPGLEIYGGPLLALAPVEPADPLASRLAGGDARNALDGDPGRYLGTELDLGVRWRALLHGAELVLGAEAGVLWPGPALDGPAGGGLDPILGGRGLLRVRL